MLWLIIVLKSKTWVTVRRPYSYSGSVSTVSYSGFAKKNMSNCQHSKRGVFYIWKIMKSKTKFFCLHKILIVTKAHWKHKRRHKIRSEIFHVGNLLRTSERSLGEDKSKGRAQCPTKSKTRPFLRGRFEKSGRQFLRGNRPQNWRRHIESNGCFYSNGNFWNPI